MAIRLLPSEKPQLPGSETINLRTSVAAVMFITFIQMEHIHPPMHSLILDRSRKDGIEKIILVLCP